MPREHYGRKMRLGREGRGRGVYVVVVFDEYIGRSSLLYVGVKGKADEGEGRERGDDDEEEERGGEGGEER